MAAMFSATMAVVSADFNAMASVLTQDIYKRLIRPSAPEHRLLFMGRWITFGLGALTTLLSLWIAFTHQQSLFNIMVVALGLFMAPTFLPLLAGLTIRRLNWQGAFTGFLCGLTTGCAMLAAKTWLPGASTAFGSSFDFEGVSLLANTAATIVGMVLGTIFFPRATEDTARVDQFFADLDTPVRESEMPAKGANPSGPALAISTIGVGCLLIVAGLIASSDAARIIDPLVGLALVVVGLLFARDSRRKVAPAAEAASEELETRNRP
jgi:uncharacterized sodium:solute symporter family permease YidK